LRLDALPLADQEAPHHCLALRQCLRFQLIEGGLLLERASVQVGDLNAVQFGYLFRLGVVVDPLDHDAVAAHGALLRANG